jgi:ABC-type Mn2+/Zn2+ transport system permease subunit
LVSFSCTLRGVLEPFDLPFVQRGMVEVLLLALAAGLIGTWVVLRGLAFFAHAVGTAAFPGLVLADGLAFSAHLGAAASAGVVAGAVGWMARRDRERYDNITALVLVGALAAGVILASDVFHSGSRVETLLFGSLLAVNASDQLWAAAAGGVVLAATLVLGPRWLATGFDAASARAQGLRSGVSDALLLALVAFVAVASLSAIGALLATALIVVPAATTRLVVDRLGRWQAATVALAAAEGVAGLWLSVQLNAPPGAAVAVLTGGVFALVALGRALGRRRAVLAVAALLALGGAGCGAGGGTGGRPGVVASTTQLGDIVRAIGGDGVHVTQILRPNTDPHDYEPRPDDVLRTADAALVVESGRGLDHWMEEVVRQSGGSPAILVAADRAPPPIRPAAAATPRAPPPTWRRFAPSTPASADAWPACRPPRASSSPTTTPSARSPAATGFASSARCCPRRPRRPSPRSALWPSSRGSSRASACGRSSRSTR